MMFRFLMILLLATPLVAQINEPEKGDVQPKSETSIQATETPSKDFPAPGQNAEEPQATETASARGRPQRRSV